MRKTFSFYAAKPDENQAHDAQEAPATVIVTVLYVPRPPERENPLISAFRKAEILYKSVDKKRRK